MRMIALLPYLKNNLVKLRIMDNKNLIWLKLEIVSWKFKH